MYMLFELFIFSSNQLIPVQILPIGSTSSSPVPRSHSSQSSLPSNRVRYYVREYGAESEVDMTEYPKSRLKRWVHQLNIILLIACNYFALSILSYSHLTSYVTL